MYLVIKRVFDIVLSLIVLAILSPLLIVIMITLKFTGEGYIFYKQKRIGYKNKNFYILKFATMLKDSPNLGTGFITLRNDPRVTPIGRFLRLSKFNELPQIFNVLLGDMSIVGPRPLVNRTFDAYPDEVKKNIYESKPGITGVGSIVFRDEEEILSKSKIPPQDFYNQYIGPYKGALELWYNKRRSLWTDSCIILLTAWYIIFPKSNLVYKIFPDLPKSNLHVGKYYSSPM